MGMSRHGKSVDSNNIAGLLFNSFMLFVSLFILGVGLVLILLAK